uniref:Uncharacterized protein n=1 Tax=Kalanchoe fedtschenkoi TaxID=63787 RepID=A0A7N0TSG3_KALFE
MESIHARSSPIYRNIVRFIDRIRNYLNYRGRPVDQPLSPQIRLSSCSCKITF